MPKGPRGERLSHVRRDIMWAYKHLPAEGASEAQVRQSKKELPANSSPGAFVWWEYGVKNRKEFLAKVIKVDEYRAELVQKARDQRDLERRAGKGVEVDPDTKKVQREVAKLIEEFEAWEKSTAQRLEENRVLAARKEAEGAQE